MTDDELERIEGIGRSMANALRAAGIRTFAQLAESDDDTKRNAIKAAGLSFAPSLSTWSRQARLLADGDEAAFAVLTARLIAGRDTEQQPARPAPKPARRSSAKSTGTSPAPAAAPTPTANPAPADPSSWSAIPSGPEPGKQIDDSGRSSGDTPFAATGTPQPQERGTVAVLERTEALAPPAAPGNGLTAGSGTDLEDTVPEKTTPAISTMPKGSGSSDTPGALEGTDTPDTPGALENSGTSDGRGALEDNDTSNTPGTLEDSGTSDVPGTLEDNGTPDAPGTLGNADGTGTAAPAKTTQSKKSESKKNEGRKADRKKSGRGSGATTR